MNSNRDDLIAGLTEDLAPVNRIKPRDGMLLVGLAALVAMVASLMIFGFWDGMINGEASGFFWITNGLAALLGCAAAAALVVGASPRVGQKSDAPAWSAAMLAVLPIAAIITLLPSDHAHANEGLNDPAAWYCVNKGLMAASLVGLACVLWLRRGAPVSLDRAGWLTGVAAGALGTVAYGITCPIDTISHLGLWHVATVGIAAVIGRFAVPPLIRW